MTELNEDTHVLMYRNKPDIRSEATDDEFVEGEAGRVEEAPLPKYIGGFDEDGRRHGRGWAFHPNGDQYDGYYRHGQRHGRGLYVFINGARYLGNYRCGNKSGHGIFLYPDGSKYEGKWKLDLKHGEGTYTYANGDIYHGNWRKGKRHGVGEYHFKKLQCCFKGTWINGVRDGPAEVYYSGYTFHGTWDNKCPQGSAFYTFGCKYMLSGYYQSAQMLQDDSSDKNLNGNDEYEEGAFGMEEGIPLNSGDTETDGKSSELSKWHCQELLKYDYSMLPQHPVPLPTSDSEEEICDLSSPESSKRSSTHTVPDEQQSTAARSSSTSTSPTCVSLADSSSASCVTINQQ